MWLDTNIKGDSTDEHSNMAFYLGLFFASALAFTSALSILFTQALSLYSPCVALASAESAQYILGMESSRDFQIYEPGLIVACLLTAPVEFPKCFLHFILSL
jgi:hypothetical protein